MINIWFKKARKATFRSVGAETELDLMLDQKGLHKKVKNINVIHGELQLRLIVMDVDNPRRKRRQIQIYWNHTKI